MLFKKKTNTETKDIWALVLNSLPNEIAKSRMIECMAKVFPISIEEASDLVDNTPIILLEGLDQVTGEQVQNYFLATGADLILTEDRTFQRRCFRAVWPSPPKFDFIESESESVSNPSLAQKEDDLNEVIRQSNSAILKSLYGSKSSEEKIDEERDPAQATPNTPNEFDEIWRRNKVEEVELATSHALQEEKITSLSQEKNELLELIATLRKENASLKEIESQFVQLKIELKTAQDRAIQLEADHVRSIEKEKQTSLSVAAARFREEEIKLIRERERLETGISDLQISLQNEKLQASETEKKWQATVQELKSKEADLVRLAAELSNFKVQTEELRRMLGQTQQAASEQQKKLEAIETRSAEEIRIKTEEVLALKQKVEEWIPLRDGLNNRNKELQNQLEGAQKQIREFASVIEQQDLLNKRNRIISQISEKETKLKEFT